MPKAGSRFHQGDFGRDRVNWQSALSNPGKIVGYRIELGFVADQRDG